MRLHHRERLIASFRPRFCLRVHWHPSTRLVELFAVRPFRSSACSLLLLLSAPLSTVVLSSVALTSIPLAHVLADAC